MRQIKAFVRSSVVDKVVERLEAVGVPGISVSRVQGVGHGYEPEHFSLAPRDIRHAPQVTRTGSDGTCWPRASCWKTETSERLGRDEVRLRIERGSDPGGHRTRPPRGGRNGAAGVGAVVLTLFGVVGVLGCEQRRADGPAPTAGPSGGTRSPAGKAPLVTPVSGRSWLHRLGLSVEETRMGQMGGASPPSRTARREPFPAADRSPSGPLGALLRRFYSRLPDDRRASEALDEPFVLTGADLYRLNCQSCHGPDGAGSPPEINSLIGPVQGTSPALIQQRMKQRGQPIDEAFARQLAADGDKPLRDRLVRGGQKMPPFGHLAGEEVDALLLYLKQLAGVPEAKEADLRVTQSVARVGEHLVKGTCHVCHDATGPGSGHMMMMRGTIPSLASFPEQKSLSDMSRKVLYGPAGMAGMMGDDRMPVFPYLTAEEVAAAYVYLATYPPHP